MFSDLRYAARLFRLTPLTSVAVVLILGLGIGGTTGIFSVVNNTLFRPMMLPDIAELVRIDDVTVGSGGFGTESNVSPRAADALLEQEGVFSAVTVQDARWFALTRLWKRAATEVIGLELAGAEKALARSEGWLTQRPWKRLEKEDGGWRLETAGSGLETSYVLKSAEPDVNASAYYWLKRNVRESDLGPDRKLIALLSARLGEPVPVDDLAHVLPRGESAGRGRARATHAPAHGLLGQLESPDRP